MVDMETRAESGGERGGALREVQKNWGFETRSFKEEVTKLKEAIATKLRERKALTKGGGETVLSTSPVSKEGTRPGERMQKERSKWNKKYRGKTKGAEEMQQEEGGWRQELKCRKEGEGIMPV